MYALWAGTRCSRFAVDGFLNFFHLAADDPFCYLSCRVFFLTLHFRSLVCHLHRKSIALMGLP